MDQPAQRLPTALFDPAAFSARLDGGDDAIACCKQAIGQASAYLHDRFRAGAEAGELVRMRAHFIDALLEALWDRSEWRDAELALVAVGGYGRGELHPHSDVDILVLLGDNSESCREQLESFLTLLWDIGLDIGHSVRTVKECTKAAAADITVFTNLMETRVLRGEADLMEQVQALTGPDRMWPSADFFRAKLEEQRVRHTKFADTEYNLEPNVKGSPGGLRDLQVIGWIAERHFGINSLD